MTFLYWTLYALAHIICPFVLGLITYILWEKHKAKWKKPKDLGLEAFKAYTKSKENEKT